MDSDDDGIGLSSIGDVDCCGATTTSVEDYEALMMSGGDDDALLVNGGDMDAAVEDDVFDTTTFDAIELMSSALLNGSSKENVINTSNHNSNLPPQGEDLSMSNDSEGAFGEFDFEGSPNKLNANAATEPIHNHVNSDLMGLESDGIATTPLIVETPTAPSSSGGQYNSMFTTTSQDFSSTHMQQQPQQQLASITPEEQSRSSSIVVEEPIRPPSRQVSSHSSNDQQSLNSNEGGGMGPRPSVPSRTMSANPYISPNRQQPMFQLQQSPHLLPTMVQPSSNTSTSGISNTMLLSNNNVDVLSSSARSTTSVPTQMSSNRIGNGNPHQNARPPPLRSFSAHGRFMANSNNNNGGLLLDNRLSQQQMQQQQAFSNTNNNMDQFQHMQQQQHQHQQVQQQQQHQQVQQQQQHQHIELQTMQNQMQQLQQQHQHNRLQQNQLIQMQQHNVGGNGMQQQVGGGMQQVGSNNNGIQQQQVGGNNNQMQQLQHQQMQQQQQALGDGGGGVHKTLSSSFTTNNNNNTAFGMGNNNSYGQQQQHDPLLGGFAVQQEQHQQQHSIFDNGNGNIAIASNASKPNFSLDPQHQQHSGIATITNNNGVGGKQQQPSTAANPSLNNVMEKLSDSMRRSAMSRNMIKSLSGRNVVSRSNSARGMVMKQGSFSAGTAGTGSARGLMRHNSERCGESTGGMSGGSSVGSSSQRPTVVRRMSNTTKHQLQHSGRGLPYRGDSQQSLSAGTNGGGGNLAAANGGISVQVNGRHLGNI